MGPPGPFLHLQGSELVGSDDRDHQQSRLSSGRVTYSWSLVLGFGLRCEGLNGAVLKCLTT